MSNLVAFVTPVALVSSSRPCGATSSIRLDLSNNARATFRTTPALSRSFLSGTRSLRIRRELQGKAAVPFRNAGSCVIKAVADGQAAGASGEDLAPKSAAQPDALTKKYTFWRYRVFLALLFGYAGSYITRSSFTYAAPVMRTEAGLSLEQIGVISSIFPTFYGGSKFVTGIIADKVKPHYFLAACLILTGLLNMAFTLSTNVTYLCLIWGLTGLISAMGGPACAKMLTSWFSQKERGTWWGLWNTSHNIGGFTAALVAGTAAASMGWRGGMILPGIAGIALGIAAAWALRSDPADVGLPPVEQYMTEKETALDNKPAAVDADAKAEASKAKPVEGAKEENYLMKYVLLNPDIWLLAVSYFFVYFIRSGVTNWCHVYLMDSKGVASAAEAAFRVSGREIGGLAGSLFSGWASDKIFRGYRIPVICSFLVGIAASVFAFWAVPAGHRWLDFLAVSMIGFFLYGPQMLIGLTGVELAHKNAASSATGFLGWIAYIGAGVAGYPLTILVKKFGWDSFFQALIVCCVCAFGLCAPLWNKKRYQEKGAPAPA